MVKETKKKHENNIEGYLYTSSRDKEKKIGKVNKTK